MIARDSAKLKVNVDNIGDISKAAGMFTPEDLEAIMRAIHHVCNFRAGCLCIKVQHIAKGIRTAAFISRL
ncbi:MAG: hypothetical protein K5669_01160 [Lachnospiraceae bacterium]|nr:hypothetical protein [Lachnospiraceae bacterium]